MSRALQVFQKDYDADCESLPASVRRRITSAIDDMGQDLPRFPHYRLTGSAGFRLRIGDYRVIYDFDAKKNEIHLHAVGHRRDIYR